MRDTVKAPRIPSLSTRWRWAASFQTRPIYNLGIELRYPAAGPNSRSDNQTNDVCRITWAEETDAESTTKYIGQREQPNYFREPIQSVLALRKFALGTFAHENFYSGVRNLRFAYHPNAISLSRNIPNKAEHFLRKMQTNDNVAHGNQR